jgi:hypothetical protein
MIGIAAIIFHLSAAAGSIFLITIGFLVICLFIFGGINIILKEFVKN